jgi:hypothetical protein
MKRVRIPSEKVIESIADEYIAKDGGKPKKRGPKPKVKSAAPVEEIISTEVVDRGPGRPPKYKPEMASAVKFLCARGATNPVLANFLGVHTQTITDWAAEHEEFAAAMREGKAEIFDPLVERALAQRALGYSVDTLEVKYVGKDAERREDVVRKHYPPDTTACIFWLKNRQPEKWRDVHDVRHGGKVEHEHKSAEELLDEIKRDVIELGLIPGQVTGLVPNGNGTKH